jgi:hypothetical protein
MSKTTTEMLARLHFDRVYKAPKRDVAGWAAVSALVNNDRRILVVVEHHQDIRQILEDTVSFAKAIGPNWIERVYGGYDRQEIRFRFDSRIKFQAADRPGKGLSRDWMVFYAEEES